MITRGRPKKRTEDVDMDDKEATPVKDIEQILPPMEPAEPIQSENQPEKPTQTAVSYTHLDVYKRQEDEQDTKKI